MLSSYKQNEKAKNYTFVLRNEIVVALSEFLIVTEADLNSGSLTSVNYALKMGKEVYTLPHRINESLGTQELVKKGLIKVIYDIDEFIYKICGIKASIFTYLYDDLKKSFDINTIEKGMFHESFFQTNYEGSGYQAYLFKIYKIEKYDLANNKIIDMSLLYSDEKSEKLFKEEINITSLKINENNLEKISEKEIVKNEIKTLEELLNGYKYE